MSTPHPLAAESDFIFVAVNSFVGRSWLVDSLLSLAVENALVKAGPIAACFIYVWHKQAGVDEVLLRRRLLLVTLLSLLVIAPVSRLISESMLVPRPFILAEPTFALDGQRLIASRPLEFRVAQTGDISRRLASLERGQVDANDLASFPSDHAAFFAAMSAGILLVSRAAGLIALAWTLLVTLGSRVAVGMHSPADIVAGALAGIVVLAAVQLASRRLAARALEGAASWTRRNEAAASTLLFIALLEAANTMQTLKHLLDLGLALGGRLL